MRYIPENGTSLMSVGAIPLKRAEKKEGKLLLLYKFSPQPPFHHIPYRNEIVLTSQTLSLVHVGKPSWNTLVVK